MKTSSVSADALLRIEEGLRQERETFDQRKEQEARWFTLRLRMGYIAALLLPGIAIACGAIVFGTEDYDGFVVRAAAAALFVDVVGLLAAV